MDVMSQHVDKKIDVNIAYSDEDQRIGEYADVSRISVSPYTFSFEFAQLAPPKLNVVKPEAKMIFRLVMSPEHAKAFHDLLGQNIKIYEDTFGEVKTFEVKGQ
jgi:hypothetical protein